MSLSKRSVFVSLALVALAAVPAAAGDEATPEAHAPADMAPLGDCGAPAPPDLASLVVEPLEAPVCSPETPTVAAGLFVEPVEQMGPPQIRRFCRCGCGIGCETDADCGEGGSCVAFVTCC